MRELAWDARKATAIFSRRMHRVRRAKTSTPVVTDRSMSSLMEFCTDGSAGFEARCGTVKGPEFGPDVQAES